MKVNIDFSSVDIPTSLDAKQVERAQKYVTGTVIEGLTVTDTSKKYGISTKILYDDRHLKNPVWNRYVQALTNECVDTDDYADHVYIRNRIKQNAMKPNATKEDFLLYERYFPWMIAYDKAKKMKELGISEDGQMITDTRNLEEKKASLLQRLKG